MDFTVVAQLTFACLTFFTTIILVYIPRKILNSNSQFDRNYRLLDLTNYFSMGVFSATCFIVLLPHVLSTFMTAVTPLKWDDALTYKTILTISMSGFFLVFLLEKLCEYCQGRGNSWKTFHDPLIDPLDKPPLHCHTENSEDSESYVVTFQDDYDDEEEEEDDDEINRRDDNDDRTIGNVLIKSHDSINEEEEDDENEDNIDENAKLVSKSILVNRNSCNNNNKNGNNNKKVTFKRNNKATSSNNSNNGFQRLVVGGMHSSNNHQSSNNFSIRCFAMLASLTIHSIFEGLSVGLMTAFWPSIHLSTSITFHQMLASVAVGASLSRNRLSGITYALSANVLSASIPLGVVVGMALVYMRKQLRDTDPRGDIMEITSSCLQAFTVGTFLYVIFVEVLPSEVDKHRDIVFKVLLLILGFSLVALLTFLLP